MKTTIMLLSVLLLACCQTTKPQATSRFSSTGVNPYFNLTPGHQMQFEGEEDGEHTTLLITVLSETKTLDGVETHIVEERETGKALKEVSRNYFVIDRATGDVYYFGEDVMSTETEKFPTTAEAGTPVKKAQSPVCSCRQIRTSDRSSQEQAAGIAQDQVRDQKHQRAR